MKDTLLIGLGKISIQYLAGLSSKNTPFNLVGTIDLKSNPYALAKFSSYPFYHSLDEIKSEIGKYALVAVAPRAHKVVVESLLNRNIIPLIEKPCATSIEDIKEIYNLGEKHLLPVYTIYHYQYSPEIYEIKRIINNDLSKAKEITFEFGDRYCNSSNNVKEDRKGLCGVWFDTGINILSILSSVFSKFEYEIIKEDRIRDVNNISTYINLELLINKITKVNIIIDWRKNSKKKSSTWKIDNDIYYLSHSYQTIKKNEEKGHKLNHTDMSILSVQYYNFFLDYNDETNKEETIFLHELLFKVGE